MIYHVLNGDELAEKFPFEKEGIYGFGDLQVKKMLKKIIHS